MFHLFHLSDGTDPPFITTTLQFHSQLHRTYVQNMSFGEHVCARRHPDRGAISSNAKKNEKRPLRDRCEQRPFFGFPNHLENRRSGPNFAKYER